MTNSLYRVPAATRDGTATHPHTAARELPFIEAWYARGSGALWSATNIAAALSVAGISFGHLPVSILVAWLVFTCINAAAYPTMSRGLRLSAGNSPAVQPALAFVFAISWGFILLLAAPALPVPHAITLALITLLVAVAAVGVFSLRRGAYPVFAIALLAAATVALNANPGIAHVGAYILCIFVFLMLVSTVHGRFSRVVLQALGNVAVASAVDREAGADDAALLFEMHNRTLKRLRRERDRSRATLGALSDAVITTTESGLVDYMNPTAEALTGIDLKHANGQPLERVVQLTTEAAQAALGACIENLHQTDAAGGGATPATLRRSNGLQHEIEYRISPLHDNDGDAAGMVCRLRNTTDQRHLKEKISWYATHDTLTNILTRREFERRLEQLLATATEPGATRHAMCYLDLDQFHYLGTAYGIDGANETLAAVSELLRQQVPANGVLARIGEDRFGILLADASSDAACRLAETLRAAIATLALDLRGERPHLSASIGVATFSAPEDDPSRSFARAQAACLRAKAGGGNQVQVIDGRDQAERFRLASLDRLHDIHTAVERGDLDLYYQEILALRPRPDARTCELLVRMRDPDAEFLLPREFLVGEDQLTLVSAIDRWVIGATADALCRNDTVLCAMDTVFVTISGRSLNDDRFVDFIVETLDAHAARSKLCFKIGEAGSISEIERARYVVAKLKNLGCRIALDNFGVGIGSFALLKRLQIDYLKINVDTIANMPHSSVDYEIVLATSRIAKTLGIETIAEGVGTHATRQALFGLGIDYIQGLQSGRPTPVTPATP